MCRETSGKVRAGLYYWVYQYRQSGISKSFSYLATMTWNNAGRLIFQPISHRHATISCLIYDSLEAYAIPIRTWRIYFTKTPPIYNPIKSNTVTPHRCNSDAPVLSTNDNFTVTVTSNMLHFSQYCPLVSCIEGLKQEFSNVSFVPNHDDICSSSSLDPGSFPFCLIDPSVTKEFTYNCNIEQLENTVGSVKLTIKSGVRFANDSDFRPIYLVESDNLESYLSCSVDRNTAPESIPLWEFMPASSDHHTAVYRPVDKSSLYKQVNDVKNGNHKLYFTKVNPQVEGSYRCVVKQNFMVPGGKPIYGYYFVKVFLKPNCALYKMDKMPRTVDKYGNVIFQVDHLFVVIHCSNIIYQCNSGQYTPIAILRKGSDRCAMSNSLTNTCNGKQSISTSSNTPGIYQIYISLNHDNDDATSDVIGSSYSVQLYYPEPINLSFELPFKFFKPPTTSTATIVHPGSSTVSFHHVVFLTFGLLLIFFPHETFK